MVSVLFLAWNHEKYIAQSLNSIIQQSWKDMEIMFLDNASTDNTFTLAQQILSDSGVPHSIYRRDSPAGISQNLNYLFSRSKGQYICLCSGDDWLHKDSIAVKMRFFDAPGVGMVYSDGYKYYDDIDVYEPFKAEHFDDKETLNELYKRNFISGTGCLIRREVIESVGPWDETLLIDDVDMWIRIASRFRIVHIRDKLFFYRKHAEALTNDYDYMYRAKLQVYEKFKHVNPFNSKFLDNASQNYLSNRVMNNTSPGTTLQVLKQFHFNAFYIKLLIKSFLPVKWKKWFYVKGLIRRNQANRPEHSPDTEKQNTNY